MKRISIARLALCLLLLGVMATPSSADTLWYNGDYDLTGNVTSCQSNQISPSFDNPTLNCRTYDDFVVPPGGWTINTLYSNNFLLNSTPITTITGAYWEIRTGVSAGDGGTLMFSGTANLSGMSVDSTGRSFDNQDPEVRVAVTNLNFVLTAGTYWQSVPPITSGGYEYVANSFTTGTGATGLILGNSYYCFYDANNNINFEVGVDCSMGIEGTVGSEAPVPASLLLLASGLLALGFYRFRARAC